MNISQLRAFVSEKYLKRNLLGCTDLVTRARVDPIPFQIVRNNLRGMNNDRIITILNSRARGNGNEEGFGIYRVAEELHNSK